MLDRVAERAACALRRLSSPDVMGDPPLAARFGSSFAIGADRISVPALQESGSMAGADPDRACGRADLLAINAQAEERLWRQWRVRVLAGDDTRRRAARDRSSGAALARRAGRTRMPSSRRRGSRGRGRWRAFATGSRRRSPTRASRGPAGAPLGLCMLKDDELYQLYVAARRAATGVAAALLADGEARLAARGVATAWLACAVGNRSRRAVLREVRLAPCAHHGQRARDAGWRVRDRDLAVREVVKP